MIIKDILCYLTDNKYDYTFDGDENEEIAGFSSLTNYKRGTMTWIKKIEATEGIDLSRVALAIVQEGVSVELRNSITVSNSKKAFFDLLENVFTNKEEKVLVGEGTYISPKVKIGSNVTIGHNCVLDGDIVIGDNTVIQSGVTIINKVKIGSNCYIQPGVTIGHDGFGYSEDEDHTKHMVKHYGGVEIGNDVFIGCHTNIARGTIDNTLIEDGVKIAPSTHIGHNTRIRKNATVICSNVYGSIEIGKNAYISACTVRNQLKVGENSIVGMGSIVTKDVRPNTTVMGVPAKEKNAK